MFVCNHAELKTLPSGTIFSIYDQDCITSPGVMLVKESEANEWLVIRELNDFATADDERRDGAEVICERDDAIKAAAKKPMDPMLDFQVGCETYREDDDVPERIYVVYSSVDKWLMAKVLLGISYDDKALWLFNAIKNAVEERTGRSIPAPEPKIRIINGITYTVEPPPMVPCEDEKYLGVEINTEENRVLHITEDKNGNTIAYVCGRMGTLLFRQPHPMQIRVDSKMVAIDSEEGPDAFREIDGMTYDVSKPAMCDGDVYTATYIDKEKKVVRHTAVNKIGEVIIYSCFANGNLLSIAPAVNQPLGYQCDLTSPVMVKLDID